MPFQFPISSPCPFEKNKGVRCGSFYGGCTHFSIVRHLNNMGINPKLKLTNVHVNENDLMEFLGPSVVTSLQTSFFMLIQNKI